MKYKGKIVLSAQAKAMLNLMGIQGFFWFGWSFTNFQTVYLQNNGLTSSDIGVLNSVSSIVGIFAAAIWGIIADRINSVKKTFIASLVLSAVSIVLMPFLPAHAKYAVTMFIIYLAAANFVRNPLGTLLDNLTIRNCTDLRLNYGPIRAFGSLTFTVGSALGTMILQYIDVKWTFWITGVLMIPPILCVCRARDPKITKPPRQKGDKSDVKALFGNYYYITFLIFAAILYVPLSTEGAFITFLMAENGIPNTNFGLFNAVRAMLEIPFLFFIAKIRQKIRLKYIVMTACTLMGTECLLLGLFADTFPKILIFACCYGLGSGLFIGSVSMYVYKLAPDSLKASAQSFYAAVVSAASILGHLIGGFAFDALGGSVFYVVIGSAVIFAVGLFGLSHILGRAKGLHNPADILC